MRGRGREGASDLFPRFMGRKTFGTFFYFCLEPFPLRKPHDLWDETQTGGWGAHTCRFSGRRAEPRNPNFNESMISDEMKKAGYSGPLILPGLGSRRGYSSGNRPDLSIRFSAHFLQRLPTHPFSAASLPQRVSDSSTMTSHAAHCSQISVM